ncbi:polymorphic toxin-type HINT domain-containing protein [Anatilimnocola floriformis]|uniref:polymorphic toxin-type HINT domain-containing protein n=1 Tax=Anatilimnocola floriformis TaxID=2948575 RepID=UPI0020C2EBF1|nr:polymorphic toxin-type HINT domain-containing protein [Anatilimnocola floriformis]
MTDYVPLMISAMYSPISTQFEAQVLPNGQTVMRKAYWREGMDHHELLVTDTSFRMNIPAGQYLGPSRNLAPVFFNQHRMENLIEVDNARTEVAVAEKNRLTDERNRRIADALTKSTGEKFAAQPDVWWKWWLDLNEWTLPDGKGMYSYYQYNRREDWTDFKWPRKTSCLNAGTPIWTDQGPVAVERLKIGDLVLSRDVESGELAYKPVLLTTVREKRQLTELMVGAEKIQATGGHLFWVSGTGWVRTKELQASDVLHTATNPVNLTAAQPGIVAETYNLVVADFHTYFVGEHKLLSHDNTVRRPTNVVVPGLKPEQ